MNYMWFLAAPLLLCIVMAGSTNIPEIRIKNDSVEYVQKGSEANLTCFFGGTVRTLLDYYVVWQFVQDKFGQRITISKNKELESNIDSNKYGASLSYPNGSVDVTISIKNVDESDDGRYICLLLNSDGAELRTTDMHVIVPAPVKQMNFTVTVDGTNRTKSIRVLKKGKTNEFDKAEKFEVGTYKIVCKTSGSNPAPSIHLYKNEMNLTGKTGNSEMETLNSRQFSAFAENKIMIDKSSVGQKLTCEVNVTTQELVIASIVISEVYSRDPRVDCSHVSVVQLNGEKQFKCNVKVDKGPVDCAYVYWSSGDSGEEFKNGTAYDSYCKALNETYLETTLTLKSIDQTSFSKTYAVVYNGPHHNTVRTETQLDNNISGVSKYESFTATFLGIVTLTILTLW